MTLKIYAKTSQIQSFSCTNVYIYHFYGNICNIFALFQDKRLKILIIAIKILCLPKSFYASNNLIFKNGISTDRKPQLHNIFSTVIIIEKLQYKACSACKRHEEWNEMPMSNAGMYRSRYHTEIAQAE